MAREDFQNRVARILDGGGGAGVMLAGEGDTDTGGFGGLAKTKRNTLNRPGPSRQTCFLLLLLFTVVGFILSSVTAAFLGPKITPGTDGYMQFLAFVAAGHLALAAATATALMARLRRKALNTVVFAGFLGYGLASALSSGLLG